MSDANTGMTIAEKHKDAQLTPLYKGILDALLTDKANYFNALERQRQKVAKEAAKEAVRKAREQAYKENDRGNVLQQMMNEAQENDRRAANAQSQRQPSFWEMNAAAMDNNLKTMQKADAARRNADYRQQNNCSGSSCNNR